MEKYTDIENEIIYNFWQNPNLLLPDFDFTKKGNKWLSRVKIDGTKPKTQRADKVYIYENNAKYLNENGGDSVSIYDLIIKKGFARDFVSALKYICDCYKIELPQYNTEEYKKTVVKNEILTKYANRFKNNLFNGEGKYLLSDYLQRVRGYSAETIEQMRDYLGFITETDLKDFNTECKKNGINLTIPESVAKYNQLVIINSTLNKITDFKFRQTKEEGEKKYINLIGAKKQFTNLHLSNEDNLIITEGEFDALHAYIKGVNNIVAVSGGGGKWVNDDLLKILIYNKIKFVTILTDTEENPKTQAITDKKNFETLKFLKKNNIIGYIAELPEIQGKKIDVDLYFNTHTVEEFNKNIISVAKPFPAYATIKIIQKYNNIQGSNFDIYRFAEDVKKLFDYFGSIEDLGVINKTVLFLQRQYQNEINADFWRLWDKYLDVEKEKKARGRQLEEIKKIYSNLDGIIKGGKIEDIEQISLQFEKAKQNYTPFEKIFKIPNYEDIINILSDVPDTIKTDYYFIKKLKNGTKKIPFEIPKGAVTLISAPTNHGKSTFLQNIALNLIKKNNKVLYFSFEESKANVIVQFISKYCGFPLSQEYSNKKIIRNYFRNGEFNANPKNIIKNNDIKNDFIKTKNEFIKNYLNSGILQIFEISENGFTLNNIDNFCNSIKYISETQNITAIFVDYIQKFFTIGKNSIAENYKYICDNLNNLSITTKLPIIIASQLNREVKTPEEMTVQNISEASDIEKMANTILLCWNTAFLPKEPPKENGEYRFNEIREKNGKEKILFNQEKAKFYIKLAKSRDFETGAEFQMFADFNTGIICNEEPENKTKEPIIKNLFEDNYINNTYEEENLPF